jgi:hypothetical protein
MVVALNPELEKVINDRAEQTGRTPEEIVNEALRRGLLTDHRDQVPPPDEWVALLRSIPIRAGVSLTDEQVSSEGIYED